MNKILLFGAATCMILALGSCKSKQSAYKTAYEQAKEKETTAPVVTTTTDEQAAASNDVVTTTTAEPTPVSKPRTSDVSTRTERINPYEGEDASRLKKYSVVIGSFKNSTNAYSLKERMQNDGYSAVLAENEQGMLRVIVSSYDSRSDAAASRDAIKQKYAPSFQDAWLLEKSY